MLELKRILNEFLEYLASSSDEDLMSEIEKARKEQEENWLDEDEEEENANETDGCRYGAKNRLRNLGIILDGQLAQKKYYGEQKMRRLLKLLTVKIVDTHALVILTMEKIYTNVAKM